MNYITLSPELNSPHDDIAQRVQRLKELTEQHGPQWVISEWPELLYTAKVVARAVKVLGPDWIRRYYPAHAERYCPKRANVVVFAVPEPVVEPEPVIEQPASVAEKSVTADCLMPDIAPAFRGLDPVPALITNDDARKILANRREADIIYLHAQGHRPYLDSSLTDGKFREMMSADTLDLDLVREFAKAVSSKTIAWSDEHLATNVLFIPETLQVRLCQLATDAIKRKRGRLIEGLPTIRTRLETSMRRSGDAKNLEHAVMWAQVWVCDELIKFARAGKVKPGRERSPQEVGLLLGAMTGRAMARSDVAKKLKAIGARL